MRISCIEPSSAMQSYLRDEKWCQNVLKQAAAKSDSEINPKRFFQSILTRNESSEVDRRTWQRVPSGTHWSTSSDTHQVVII